jgi:phosphodiester glycosidase
MLKKPRQRRVPTRLAIGMGAILLLIAGAIFAFPLWNKAVVSFGGFSTFSVSPDSSCLSQSMRLALATSAVAKAGPLTWRTIAQGFEVGDLAAFVDGKDVDHIFLARIDPIRFRFIVRNAPDGSNDLDEWVARLKPALVVNGSYYAHDGKPDTPVVADGVTLGPREYDAKAGAFIASTALTGIRDLAAEDWKSLFSYADDAMVSYPLLVKGGAANVSTETHWLANRSFVGQDQDGRIIIGTTTDAFFSLFTFSRFLVDAQLGLALALNLDGGPVASQSVQLNGFTHRTYGRWEAQLHGNKLRLFAWCYGFLPMPTPMPIILAVIPR